MSEIGPEHPTSYRREVVAPFFQVINARDSCAIVGPSSMGKSRLLQFLMRPDVQKHYLGEQTQHILFAWADHNRLAELSEWGVYELLLTSLVEASGQLDVTRSLRNELTALRREIIHSVNPLLARRQLELAAHILCQEQKVTLCFLLDEFDACYRSLPPMALANLRALRDAHKYKVCYALFLREHPARLRPTVECEGFYELFSRAVIGLTPYNQEDVCRMISQLEVRKNKQFSQEVNGRLFDLSGGHPGLLVALFELAAKVGLDATPAELIKHRTIKEECEKLWLGLAEDEQLTLLHLPQIDKDSEQVLDVLQLKGVVQKKEGHNRLFSPLFAEYVKLHGRTADKILRVDETKRTVLIGEYVINDLQGRPFDLLAYLFRREGQVCERDEALAYLYPDEEGSGEDNRIDNLVKRIRQRIEPTPKRPIYLLTVHGKGYKLLTNPAQSV